MLRVVARQIQNLIKVFIDATDVKRSERVESVDKFDAQYSVLKRGEMRQKVMVLFFCTR